MPFDDEKWRASATHGDVGGIALSAAIALKEVLNCLNALNRGQRIEDEQFANIQREIDWFHKEFVELTGYKPGDGQ